MLIALLPVQRGDVDAVDQHPPAHDMCRRRQQVQDGPQGQALATAGLAD